MRRFLLATSALASCGSVALPASAQQSQQQGAAAEPAVNRPTRGNVQVDAPTPGETTPAGPSGQAVGAGIQDIVVTAQRQSESLQRAAIAVSAVSGDTLAAAGVSRPTELTSVVPALQVAPAAGPYNLFYLRGVGNFNGNAFSDSAIAFNFDGAYISRPSSTTGFFYDLERVEVVKGPQGTLYGRNATGGAINVISKRPELNAYGVNASAEYGNYNSLRVDAAVNVPLGELAALRIAGIRVSHDGYYRDGTDDQDDWGARMSFRLEPNNALSINIVADYFDQRGRGVGSEALGSTSALAPTEPIADRYGFLSARGQAFYTAQPNTLNGRTFGPVTVPTYQSNNYWGVTSTIDYKASFGTFTLVPSYRRSEINYTNFLPGFYVHQVEKADQESVEGRFASDQTKPIRLLLGGFVFHEDTADPLVEYRHQSNINNQTNVHLSTSSQAVFGRVTWAITPEIRLTAGGRYTWEQKTLEGLLQTRSAICTRTTTYFPTYVAGCPLAQPYPYGYNGTLPTPGFDFVSGVLTLPAVVNNLPPNNRRATFKRATYRLGADWDVTPRNLLYASYETGFKSGGFFFSSDVGTYQPERIEAYTLGSKNRFLADRVQINLEGFYWKYKDQQISHLGYDSQGIAIFPTENVGRATFKGVEAEIQVKPAASTTLSTDIQYLDAVYDSFIYSTPNLNAGLGNGTSCSNLGPVGANYVVNCSGKRPPNAPEITINVSGQQRFELGNGSAIVADARAHHQSTTLTGVEFLPIEYQKAYWTADAALTFYAPKRRFFIGGFVNNAFDKTVVSASFPTPFSLFVVGALRPPRTYGVRAGVNF